MKHEKEPVQGPSGVRMFRKREPKGKGHKEQEDVGRSGWRRGREGEAAPLGPVAAMQFRFSPLCGGSHSGAGSLEASRRLFGELPTHPCAPPLHTLYTVHIRVHAHNPPWDPHLHGAHCGTCARGLSGTHTVHTEVHTRYAAFLGGAKGEEGHTSFALHPWTSVFSSKMSVGTWPYDIKGCHTLRM